LSFTRQDLQPISITSISHNFSKGAVIYKNCNDECNGRRRLRISENCSKELPFTAKVYSVEKRIIRFRNNGQIIVKDICSFAVLSLYKPLDGVEVLQIEFFWLSEGCNNSLSGNR